MPTNAMTLLLQQLSTTRKGGLTPLSSMAERAAHEALHTVAAVDKADVATALHGRLPLRLGRWGRLSGDAGHDVEWVDGLVVGAFHTHGHVLHGAHGAAGAAEQRG
jgi:hypothetical protein